VDDNLAIFIFRLSESPGSLNLQEYSWLSRPVVRQIYLLNDAVQCELVTAPFNKSPATQNLSF
jgi:hypothetical protein